MLSAQQESEVNDETTDELSRRVHDEQLVVDRRPEARLVEEAPQGDEQLPTASLQGSEREGLGNLHVETGIEPGAHAIRSQPGKCRAESAPCDDTGRRLGDLRPQRRRHVLKVVPVPAETLGDARRHRVPSLTPSIAERTNR